MFEAILKPEIQQFINSHLDADPAVLALRNNPFPEASWTVLLHQIASKSKARRKLPTWFNTDGIIYPPKISIEQTSSERTAAYKASLVSGQSLIDLSGGFGVDDYYFARTVAEVVHCEINPQLSAIVAHNFSKLNTHNVRCIAGDSSLTLQGQKQRFDWIYIDPSRRNESKGKVFLLTDCEPNVPALQQSYFAFTDRLLVKAAPVLDISAALRQLQWVKTIHLIAVENEMKEMLFEMQKGHQQALTIQTVNCSKSGDQFFEFAADDDFRAPLSAPQRYLYEPNAAIMKSGGFDAVAQHYPVMKLHQHSHLYTAYEVLDFPGRRFEIVQELPYSKAGMKQSLANQQANISTRNFPESVENIRKKWKIRDGGDRYCFFTTDRYNRKIVLICAKI